MAFRLELHETIVAPYLAGLELSAEGRETLIRVLDDLAAYGNIFMGEPGRRMAPGSSLFRVNWIFLDPTTNVVHALRFIISDAAAPFGVLRIEFVDGETSVYSNPFSA